MLHGRDKLLLSGGVGVPDVAVDFPGVAGSFPDDDVFAFLDEGAVGVFEGVGSEFVDEVAGAGGFGGGEFGFEAGFDEGFPEIADGGAAFHGWRFEREDDCVFGVESGNSDRIAGAGGLGEFFGEALDFRFDVGVSGGGVEVGEEEDGACENGCKRGCNGFHKISGG